MLARAEAAELVLSELGGLKRGTLAVQASQTIAGYWLPRHLVAFRRLHPAIELRLTIGNTAQVAAAVNDGIAELGFVEGVVNNQTLTSQLVARDQMVVVVGAGHAWGGRAAVTTEELAAGEWVLREPGSGTRAVLEQALAALGIVVPNVALELPSNEAVRAAVEAGMGATALSATVATAALAAGTLRDVPFALPERDFRVLRHAGRYRSRAGDALLGMISRSPEHGSGPGSSPKAPTGTR